MSITFIDPVTTMYEAPSTGLLIIAVSLTITCYLTIYKINSKISNAVAKISKVMDEYQNISKFADEVIGQLKAVQEQLSKVSDASREGRFSDSNILESSKEVKDDIHKLQIQVSVVAASLSMLIDNFKQIISRLIDNMGNKQ